MGGGRRKVEGTHIGAVTYHICLRRLVLKAFWPSAHSTEMSTCSKNMVPTRKFMFCSS